MIVDEGVDEADLLEVSNARFAGEEMKFGYDLLFDSKWPIDRCAEGRCDRLTVRQPPREKEYELPFDFSGESLIHCYAAALKAALILIRAVSESSPANRSSFSPSSITFIAWLTNAD